MNIPFVKVHLTGKEKYYISKLRTFSGDGHFTQLCHQWLEKNIGVNKVLLTPSCTAALEMAALLINTTDGDEVIMPSYTFTSTANAFSLRGGIPVFIDIRPDTLNIDEKQIESAITPKTKAIVPVHYAGVSCEMDVILSLANKYNLFVIEDAAQAMLSKYKGRNLGTLSHMGAYSFHETKNIVAGEGGSLLINDSQFIEMAEIIREKGTNRSQFHRGEIDKYTWHHLGSSYLSNELTAAFLFAQLEAAESITRKRLKLWEYYHASFVELENNGLLRRPIIPAECQHNGHMYYILVSDRDTRSYLINFLKKRGIMAVFHYIPLHTSFAGKKYGRIKGQLKNTELASDCIIRLPLFFAMNESLIDQIVDTVTEGLYSSNGKFVTR